MFSEIASLAEDINEDKTLAEEMANRYWKNGAFVYMFETTETEDRDNAPGRFCLYSINDQGVLDVHAAYKLRQHIRAAMAPIFITRLQRTWRRNRAHRMQVKAAMQLQALYRGHASRSRSRFDVAAAGRISISVIREQAVAQPGAADAPSAPSAAEFAPTAARPSRPSTAMRKSRTEPKGLGISTAALLGGRLRTGAGQSAQPAPSAAPPEPSAAPDATNARLNRKVSEEL